MKKVFNIATISVIASIWSLIATFVCVILGWNTFAGIFGILFALGVGTMITTMILSCTKEY